MVEKGLKCFLTMYVCRKNGKTIHVIDPAYKESVEAKVVEVFGERSLEHVYSMIEDVVEDEKMVCYVLLYFLI